MVLLSATRNQKKYSLANLQPPPTHAQVKFLWKHARCSELVGWFRLSEGLVQKQADAAERTRANNIVLRLNLWKPLNCKGILLEGKTLRITLLDLLSVHLKATPKIWGNRFMFHNAPIRLPKLSARAQLWGRAWGGWQSLSSPWLNLQARAKSMWADVRKTGTGKLEEGATATSSV